MAARQNSDDAFRLLLAQRRLYSRAKRWQNTRWIGLFLLGIAAPFISLLVPVLAVAVGALTGIWLFVGRTVISTTVARTITKAAVVQEELDLYIFDMPKTIERAYRPTIEEIQLLIQVKKRKKLVTLQALLINWYDIDISYPGAATIAIAQRANCSYSYRLIRTFVLILSCFSILWITFLIVLSALSGLSFGLVLLGVIFPVLPAALDVAEYIRISLFAAQERGNLARTIEVRLKDKVPITGLELVSWQTEIYDLRRATPLVPDWLYKLSRSRNEKTMRLASIFLRKES
jgi:hypothetical protein